MKRGDFIYAWDNHNGHEVDAVKGKAFRLKFVTEYAGSYWCEDGDNLMGWHNAITETEYDKLYAEVHK